MTHDETWPVSRVYDFQVWLQCWRYHYYLLIWCCLTNFDVRYLWAYIKSYRDDVFLWTLQKILELYPILWSLVSISSANRQFLQVLGRVTRNCPSMENHQTRTLEEILVLYAAEATFAITSSCLLFSTSLKFSIEYVLYDSLKIYDFIYDFICCLPNFKKTA